MKNKELYYLIINTKTALNELGITYEMLSIILGVSVDSVTRWLNNRQTPNELNMYKLHWFVHLALDKAEDFTLFTWFFRLYDLTLDTNPFGKGYNAPWEKDYKHGVEVLDKLFKNKSDITDESHIDDDDYYKLCDDECLNEDVDYEIKTLVSVIKEHNEDILTDVYDIETLFDHALELDNCTYQEAIRQIEFLKKLCDIYIDCSNETLLDNKEDIKEFYVRVHDFDSFVDFLDAFEYLSSFDERYDYNRDHFKIILSKYSDPKYKSINRTEVMTIRAVEHNHVYMSCADESEHVFFNDDTFFINNMNSNGSDNFDFIIRVGKEYYALSFEYSD